MNDWYPGARRNPAPTKYWGTYTGGPFKGVLHTTETDSFSPHVDSYGGWHTSYPHFTVILVHFPDHDEVWIYQHIPLSRAARALKNLSGGVQTNTDKAIQIEIVWRAGNAQNMPAILLDAIGHLMRWIEGETGIKRKSSDDFHFYPPENKIQLGREPWRMSGSAWDRYDGWCGHMHVPENVHGDPGKIAIRYLLDVGAVVAPPPAISFVGTLEEETVRAEVKVNTDDRGNGWRDTAIPWVQYRSVSGVGFDPPFVGGYLNPVVTAHNVDNQIRVVVTGWVANSQATSYVGHATN